MRNKTYKINNHNKNNNKRLNLEMIKKVINTCQQNIIIRVNKHRHHVP